MTAKLLLRIAAISLLTIILGHSTTLLPHKPMDLTETLVLKGMKTYEMDFFVLPGTFATIGGVAMGLSLPKLARSSS